MNSLGAKNVNQALQYVEVDSDQEDQSAVEMNNLDSDISPVAHANLELDLLR